MFRKKDKTTNTQQNHLTENEIIEFVDKTLAMDTVELSNELSSHLNNCAFCKHRVMEIKITYSDMDLEEITLSKLNKWKPEINTKDITSDGESLILDIIPEKSFHLEEKDLSDLNENKITEETFK